MFNFQHPFTISSNRYFSQHLCNLDVLSSDTWNQWLLQTNLPHLLGISNCVSGLRSPIAQVIVTRVFVKVLTTIKPPCAISVAEAVRSRRDRGGRMCGATQLVQYSRPSHPLAHCGNHSSRTLSLCLSLSKDLPRVKRNCAPICILHWEQLRRQLRQVMV